MSDETKQAPSLMPYETWTDDALREVVVRAIEHVAKNGLPGEHHFYLTFRTDHSGTKLPGHLRARYPQEMTIVLQHQFDSLAVDRQASTFSVRLYFGGVPAMLTVPLVAVTGFADPLVRYGLRFNMAEAVAAARPIPEDAVDLPAAPEGPAQVVSLDAFRRRPTRE